MLQDTRCSGAIVKAQFVEKEQYLGKDGYMMMMDKTIRKASLARTMVDTLFYIVPSRFNILFNNWKYSTR